MKCEYDALSRVMRHLFKVMGPDMNGRDAHDAAAVSIISISFPSNRAGVSRVTYRLHSLSHRHAARSA